MRRYWTDAELWRLIALYPTKGRKALRHIFGRRDSSIYQMAGQLGLTKDAAYLARKLRAEGLRLRRSGKCHRFPKGNVPWNAGKKGWESGGRSVLTRFRRGHKPQTWLPLGSERVNKGTLQRKITDTGYPPRDWRSVHSLIWEAAHWPIPAGHVVIFKDKNPRNFALDNLECLSRADLMRRNSIHNYPQPLKSAMHVLGQLNRRIREKQNRGLEKSLVRHA